MLDSLWPRRCVIGILVTAFAMTLTLSVPLALAGDGAWTSSGPADDIGSVAVAPSAEQIVYAVGKAAIWKSTNSGASWTAVSRPPAIEYGRPLVVDPTDPSVLYGGGPGNAGGILKSRDGGASWSTVRAGGYPTALAIDPTRPRVLYAGIFSNGAAQLFKTTDAGATWGAISQSVTASPGWPTVRAIAIEPRASNTVYAAWEYYHAGDVLRSDDAGATWASTGAGRAASLMSPTAMTAGKRSAGAAGGTVYSSWTALGAVKVLASADGGNSWQDVSGGIPSGTYGPSDIIVREDDTTLIAAMGSAGVQISTDRARTWAPLGSPANIGSLAYAPATRTLFGTRQNGVWQYTFADDSNLQVASPFAAYYAAHDGVRLLGAPLSKLSTTGKYPSQYFEKGRIEDHSNEIADPAWRFMYGLLVDELQQAGVKLPIGGDTSTVTYDDLRLLARESQRVPAPRGFASGTETRGDGSVFVPFTADLSSAPGHNIPRRFWAYINRDDLFPGGWLHDVGLPITEPVAATVDKGNMKGRAIVIQGFQRTVLTYDPANPAEWQVERANAGSDYTWAFPGALTR